MNGISERGYRDPDDEKSQPNLRGSYVGSDPRPSCGTAVGPVGAENPCGLRGEIGSARHARRDGAARNEHFGPFYDTLSDSYDDGASYNGGAASLFERAVIAIESIASALHGIAAEKPQQAEPPSQFDRTYRTGEVANLLGLNEQTVRRYCRERRFGLQTEGGRWLIRQSEVDRFLQGRAQIHGKGKGVR